MKKQRVAPWVIALTYLFVATGVSSAAKYQEAPMLAALVRAGKLPPVEQRLPKEPFVVGPGTLITKEDLPKWASGRYGGTLRSVHAVADWAPDVFVMSNEPLLIAPGIGVQGVKGNVVQSFEASNDNRVFTFRLRQGLKWSDGQPVTTADIRFTYEDVLLNDKLTPIFPARFRTGGSSDGQPMKLDILDDYTFRITFPQPYGGFLRQLAIEGWVGYSELLRPAHYLKQFHPKYTSIEKLRPLLKAQNLGEEWWTLFEQKQCLNWDLTEPRCAGYPSLYPWVIKDSSPGILVFERNPYYFKVDVNGKQLPYIDRIQSVQVQDVEMANLKVLTGEVDFLRESTALVKVPLYKENEKKANIAVRLLDMHVDSSVLFVNLTYNDPNWRKVVEDVRFREALSHAIDRQEIIDSIYYGFAAFPTTIPSKYDKAQANRLLDAIGLNRRDRNGYRLGLDGKTFEILIESGAHAPDLMPVGELVVAHLKEVGIKATLKQIDPQLWSQRVDANEIQATLFWSHDQGWDGEYTGNQFVRVGPLWNKWNTTNGKEGTAPPDWVKEAYKIDSQRWAALSGSAEYDRLKKAGQDWHHKWVPQITIVEKVKYPMITSADLGNVPESGYAIAANFSGEQFYFKK